MALKELMEAVQIEGAGRGDVVFIEVAASMSANDFTQFSEAFRTHANKIRADGYFPRCIILPPGTRAVVAQRHATDELVLGGGLKLCGQLAVSPDAGFPHG